MNGSGFSRNPMALAAMIAKLPRLLRLYIRLMRDYRVPMRAKGVVIGALIYLISPIDLLPDMLLPVIGQVDDIAVWYLAFRMLSRLSPPEVVAEHQAAINR